MLFWSFTLALTYDWLEGIPFSATMRVLILVYCWCFGARIIADLGRGRTEKEPCRGCWWGLIALFNKISVDLPRVLFCCDNELVMFLSLTKTSSSQRICTNRLFLLCLCFDFLLQSFVSVFLLWLVCLQLCFGDGVSFVFLFSDVVVVSYLVLTFEGWLLCLPCSLVW